MNIKSSSIIFSFLLIAGLLFYQASKTGTSTVYLPSELQMQSDLKRIRVGGRVTADTKIEYQTEPEITLKFAIRNPGGETETAAIPVIYKGIKPDMFAAGRDVIIDGDFQNGTIIAQELLTQCPSKYEPPTPTKP